MSEVATPKTIGERLKFLRGKISRAKFAEMFMVAASSLARWEADESQPDLVFLVRLTGYFQVTLGWLIAGEEPDEDVDFAEQQLAMLSKPPTSELLKSDQNEQHTENTTSQKNKTSDGRRFSEKLDQSLDMIQQLQTRVLSTMEENAALREERAELRAELKALAGELARYKSGELPVFSACAAPAAPETAPGSEQPGGPGVPGMPPLREERQGYSEKE